MQVDPINPKLKPPGTMLLKLICDEPLSNVGFKFNLRRYNEGKRHLYDAEERGREARTLRRSKSGGGGGGGGGSYHYGASAASGYGAGASGGGSPRSGYGGSGAYAGGYGGRPGSGRPQYQSQGGGFYSDASDAYEGKAVQVAPIKPKLKAPGINA